MPLPERRPAAPGRPSSTAAATSPGREAAPAEKAPAPTGVGSYFVANYPPFSFWKPEAIPAAREVLARPGAADAPWACTSTSPSAGCGASSATSGCTPTRTPGEVEGYLDALVREVELYAALPAVSGRSAPVRLLRRRHALLPLHHAAPDARRRGSQAAIPWDRAEEVTFECEPGTLTRKKLDVIREIGVTRL